MNDSDWQRLYDNDGQHIPVVTVYDLGDGTAHLDLGGWAMRIFLRDLEEWRSFLSLAMPAAIAQNRADLSAALKETSDV